MGGGGLTLMVASGELAPPSPLCQRSTYAQEGTDRMGWREVARALLFSERTAQRRLAEWFAAPLGTAPRTELRPDPTRRGRSSYTTTRAELVRYYPEIDDG